MIRCDHCRRQLGREIHRYWQMRFCSLVCVESYRSRLDEDTQIKIHQLKIDEIDFAEAQDLRKADMPRDISRDLPKIEAPNTKKPWFGNLVRSLPR
jgi:hypothetical protein